MNDELTLEELARLSRMSLRTLRYYIAEGLLIGPDTRGKNASYPRLNLDRLEMIRRLKKRYLPLQEIKLLLDNMSEADIQKMLLYQEQVSSDVTQIKSDSRDKPLQADVDLNALDYIKSLEQAHGMLKSVSELQEPTTTPLQMGRISGERPYSPLHQNNSKVKTESWRRIKITEGLELNVRSNREKELKAALEKLIDFSRDLFTEN